MSRFFKKSNNINALEEKDIEEFLMKEKLNRKIAPDRVQDFYNALSTLMLDGTIQEETDIDYGYFNCKTQEDIEKVDAVRMKESSFIRNIDKDIISQPGRLLKAAAALSHRFEKMMYDPSSTQGSNNEYLKNLFKYEEEQEELGDPVEFDDLLELDYSFLKYIAMLSTRKAFLKNNMTLEENPEGKIVKYKPMDGLADVVNGDLIQCVMPDFNKKLATEDLYVRRRFDKKKKSQNLIIMVDDSGSMKDPEKKAMLKAAITLKLREWEVNTIYIGTFITAVFGYVKVDKKMKFEDLRHIQLNKGVTAIDDCVRSTIKDIKARKLPMYHTAQTHELSDDHFEILIVNDGEDHIDPSYHPDIKLHACCLKKNNTALKNICLRSGGTYSYLKGEEE